MSTHEISGSGYDITRGLDKKVSVDPMLLDYFNQVTQFMVSYECRIAFKAIFINLLAFLLYAGIS